MIFLMLSGCETTNPVRQNTSTDMKTSRKEKRQEYILDYKDPINIIEADLYAARTGDIDVMTNLCDPLLMNDDTTENICLLELENHVIQRFRNRFEKAIIVGDVDYESNFARVNLRGIDDEDETGTFTLVKRYGNWFLFGFQ
jgi:hypothetical protein